MEVLYNQLGFKQPEFVENPYGIKIYIGTKGEDDWCVSIPKELVEIKCQRRCIHYNNNKDFEVYFITEEHALEMAKEFTELARTYLGMQLKD